jgi:hypothetical protein
MMDWLPLFQFQGLCKRRMRLEDRDGEDGGPVLFEDLIHVGGKKKSLNSTTQVSWFLETCLNLQLHETKSQLPSILS